MKIDKMFTSMSVSSDGLRAQRKRMNAIAQNIANAETTRTQDGTPYRRIVVQLKATEPSSFSTELQNAAVPLGRIDDNHLSGEMMEVGSSDQGPTGIEAEEVRDTSPFRMVYNPGHPDADEKGYVKMPNVNIVTEMVDMIAASRTFEANVVAISAEKTMAKDSLEI
jgi:flagellar basal-body rod protein FlgC